MYCMRCGGKEVETKENLKKVESQFIMEYRRVTCNSLLRWKFVNDSKPIETQEKGKHEKKKIEGGTENDN